MSFRQRITLLTAIAIAVTVAGASAAVWLVAKHELYTQLDQTVAAQALNSGGPFGGSRNTRTIHANGTTSGNPLIPITSDVLRVVHVKQVG